MADTLALRLDGNAFVPCEHVGPRLGVSVATNARQYGGSIVGLPGGAVVVYVPLGEPFDVEHHRPAILAALGRCNACACLFDEHNDEDRATCAEILREIAADEALHGR